MIFSYLNNYPDGDKQVRLQKIITKRDLIQVDLF